VDDTELEATRQLAIKTFKKYGKVIEVGVGNKKSSPILRVALKEKPKNSYPSEINGIPVKLIILNKYFLT
jgi:hypothetical protein